MSHLKSTCTYGVRHIKLSYTTSTCWCQHWPLCYSTNVDRVSCSRQRWHQCFPDPQVQRRALQPTLAPCVEPVIIKNYKMSQHIIFNLSIIILLVYIQLIIAIKCCALNAPVHYNQLAYCLRYLNYKYLTMFVQSCPLFNYFKY